MCDSKTHRVGVFVWRGMEESPYARVSEDRIPMLRKERGAQAEDLSQSLFFGFNSVLNARDARIDAGAMAPEPAAAGVDQSSDAFFWSSNPNHSLLLINDLKHKGQVYIDDVSSNSVAWDKLLRRWLVASLLLPVYILYSLRGPGPAPQLGSERGETQPRASRAYRLAAFIVGTLYYVLLFGSSAVFFIFQPANVTVTEVLLPLALHFFCFFVEALLCSIELSSVESFDEAADLVMCRMQVRQCHSSNFSVRLDSCPPSLSSLRSLALRTRGSRWTRAFCRPICGTAPLGTTWRATRRTRRARLSRPARAA